MTERVIRPRASSRRASSPRASSPASSPASSVRAALKASSLRASPRPSAPAWSSPRPSPPQSSFRASPPGAGRRRRGLPAAADGRARRGRARVGRRQPWHGGAFAAVGFAAGFVVIDVAGFVTSAAEAADSRLGTRDPARLRRCALPRTRTWPRPWPLLGDLHGLRRAVWPLVAHPCRGVERLAGLLLLLAPAIVHPCRPSAGVRR